jgi:putative ABC transport system permease protein
MSYALATIWHERSRFLPAILAVAFSAVLVAVQTGLLVGLLAMMSTPVDKSTAEIWVGFPGVQSVDLGFPIPSWWKNRLKQQPEISGEVEEVLMGLAQWSAPPTSSRPVTLTEVCMVIGTRLDSNSIGAVEPIRRNPQLLAALAEPLTVLIDRSDCHRLGVEQVNDEAVIMLRRVRVVGFVDGVRSLGGAYVFCSSETARMILGIPQSQATYLLASCTHPEDAPRVVERLRQEFGKPGAVYQSPKMSAFTRNEFSFRTRMNWMTMTKAGLAIAFTAMLGLLVGAVVTSQTLYAATAAAQREYATLRAMGIPRWRLQLSVLTQSFWVGLGGLIVATPVTLILAEAARWMGTQVQLTANIVLPAAVITMGMSMGSGLLALRSLQKTDPVHNIR